MRGRQLRADGPVGFRTKTDWAHLQLREWIQTGELAPGQRLEQERLAAELGVSRDPLRSALVRLQAEGLVVGRAHAGFSVAPLSLHEARDVYACREAVEVMLAATAAPLLDDDAVQGLEELLGRQRQAGGDRDLTSYLQLDRQFHELLYGRSFYTQSLDVVTRLRDLSDRYVFTFLGHTTHLQESLAEHAALLEACRDRDSRAVAEATRHHVTHGLTVLTELVTSDPRVGRLLAEDPSADQLHAAR